ncbi:hypothetical protein EDB83DRAFT_2524663 [Lactarius deliciosus]|nr:hypothetical protein EDB83DRAFT_2524663 [Lactarius deliciosus]
MIGPDAPDVSRPPAPGVELEYKYMCTLAGPDASVAFTHISSAAAAALPLAFAERAGSRMRMTKPHGAAGLAAGLTPSSSRSDSDAGAFAWFFSALHDRAGTNIRCVRDRVEAVTIPSCAASQISHIHLRSATTPSTSASTKPPNPATHAPRDVPSFDIVCEERLLRDIVEEALA